VEARRADPVPAGNRQEERESVRAVVYDRYGAPDVLRLADVERPTPKEGEVLVRVHATTATRSDCGLRSAEYVVSRFFTGIFRPKRGTVGLEFAGEVESVGEAVTEFAVGDRVFGIRSGASGSIGVGSVQVAKHLGAHVTAVCNTKNVDLVRSLGADEVIDYLREDFTKNGETYDVVLDAAGKQSFLRCRRSLKPDGLYVTTDPGFMWHDAALALLSKRARLGLVRYRKPDLLTLAELIEAGKYRPVIDRTYPLEDVVDAHRYVETHQKTGNVVLTVDGARPR
jgi:NADPH:quinone reductase-like Zn-dependent oxidoreductase